MIVLLVILLLLHLICVFCNIVLACVAENKRVIYDKNLAIAAGIFLPLGAMVFIAALWTGKYICDRLS